MTSRQDQLRQFARWVQAAGLALKTDSTGLPEFEFEISPCFAVDELDFVRVGKLCLSSPQLELGPY